MINLFFILVLIKIYCCGPSLKKNRTLIFGGGRKNTVKFKLQKMFIPY